MLQSSKTDIVLRKLVVYLRTVARKNKAPIWRAVAEELEKPRRKRRAVNVGRINRYTKPGDVVVVPGKVLGAGILDHPVTVAAYRFSELALEKIRSAGGRAITIKQLVSEYPSGSGVKIIG